ncbi:DNA excision repair protein ERCC-6-like [Diabrotica virgifera virgifera]|uniref:DNA repair and recombination protein RAD54-like n=1 Tax=Diabrotica virgifera virgifera TaxID=50390 RepID=A0ABM5K2D2_DIAVI|nr:DNA excision repair protein ERCC-6-like [Diabrotica virgifera virgifera]
MNNQDDLHEILLEANVNVWSKDQSALEEQALKELKVLANEQNEAQTGSTVLEDGEIEDEIEKVTPSLDLAAYIKRQEDLKKRQDFKKSLNRERKVVKKRSIIKQKIVDIGSRDDNDDEISNVPLSESENGTENPNLKNDVEVYREDNSGSEYIPSDGEYDSDYEEGHNSQADPTNNLVIHNKPKTKRKRTQNNLQKVIDDAVWENYKSRLDKYYKGLQDEMSERIEIEDVDDNEEEDYCFKGGLKVPMKVWNKLYKYQQDSIKWLWKIHQKATGGLLGDEMGLGKTVQIIAFLLSLEHSRICSCHGRFNGLGPSIIVCPATVIHQWVKHFHDWAPEFRVGVLHQSGSYQGNKSAFIKDMHKTKGIIVTTYLAIIKYQTELLDYNWHYVILDEGHKIRNPNAKATIAIKLFRTPHRIMLTGSPMQNDLTELWSLFDYTNPGMLGNMKTFQEHFSSPILQGGFTNSTPMQEATALSVASTLKDLITPYMLRRTKNEVQHHISLPNKTEQVLFCSLSAEQKRLYMDYLLGDDISHILGKGVKNWSADKQIRARVFVAITKLRKICNHPDIYLSENIEDENNSEDPGSSKGEKSFGFYKKSGKMIVVSALLKIWKKQGHRVLLFTQGRSMITIFQDFLEQQGYKYLKMDGTTSIGSRQPLIEKFNMDTTYDVFLLTTRVGGLGVNLTGANRVIIYDPDWNPATDTQARERAWRIGQDKQVTIYRLLTAGTIEEKMYQRQVWKQLLSNKILLDPKTNKFFRSSDLFDLFSLQEPVDANPETVNIFHNSRVRIQDRLKESKKQKKRKETPKDAESCFTEDKIQQMKNLAQQIAKSLNKKPTVMQMELEAERAEKQEKREEMKTLEVGELHKYNKEKEKQEENTTINKIDDRDAIVSFSDALQYSEKTAQLHNKLKQTKELTTIAEEARTAKLKITKEPDKFIDKFKKKDKSVNKSGRVDGQHVEGLVKVEIKKKKKSKESVESAEPDDFILGKLFQKKGVSGAVQHDSIVQEGCRGGSLRIHTEARIRAEKSLEALRKSRVDNWRW